VYCLICAEASKLFEDLNFNRCIFEEKALQMDKRNLSEGDICTKFITPALRSSGWDEIV